jgi:pimeloyl-ACP methyl ester carboxylesterase
MSTASDLWRWLRIWILALGIVSCSDSENDPDPEPQPEYLIEATSIGSWPAAQLKFFAQLSGQDIDVNIFQYDVEIYRVIYRTEYQDSEIEASGLIVLPKTTTDELPMISYQHGTIVKQSDAPSDQEVEGEQVISYSGLASTGFITVVPDMIGFGESKELFHPYYIEEPTAEAVTDMLQAAREFAEEKGVSFDGRVFLAGYSQGGYATLAAHKSLESDPIEGFSVTASFPGAGGYDVTEMLNYFRSLETYEDPYYLAYVGLSYQSYYDETSLLSNFFNEPYATQIPSLFNGINSSGDINDGLTTSIAELVKEDILTNPQSSPLYTFLTQRFSENSLVDWTPSAPVFLYHGDADVTVPLSNSQSTYEKLIANGADPEELQLIVLPGGDHSTAVQPYVREVIGKLQEMK